MNDYPDFTDANNLIAGYRRAEKASGWKEYNQHYGLNLLRETYKLQQEVRSGNYSQGTGATFKLCEQGHLRVIRALNVRDMALQHSLCDAVLVPALTKYLIHDNGASLKGKGMSFTRRRLEQHLRWHYRRYGCEGYVLKIDFRKYFDNIRHDVLRELIAKRITDPAVLDVLDKILKANEIDVSYLAHPELAIDEVFNALDYSRVDKSLLTGERYMPKSLGIGSPISQIAGLYLPSEIDTYCKTVKGVRCYDVYMDDRIVIHPSREYLWQLLAEIRARAEPLGLIIHDRKTQITKLSDGFSFLKTRYLLTPSGKIIRKIPRDVVTRERRKLKKLAALMQAGEISKREFTRLYQAWRAGKAGYYNAHHTLLTMDKLFKELKENGRKAETD